MCVDDAAGLRTFFTELSDTVCPVEVQLSETPSRPDSGLSSRRMSTTTLSRKSVSSPPMSHGAETGLFEAKYERENARLHPSEYAQVRTRDYSSTHLLLPACRNVMCSPMSPQALTAGLGRTGRYRARSNRKILRAP